MLLSTAVHSLSSVGARAARGPREIQPRHLGYPGDPCGHLQDLILEADLSRGSGWGGGGASQTGAQGSARWVGEWLSFLHGKQGSQREAGVGGGCSWRPGRPFSTCPKRAALICRAQHGWTTAERPLMLSSRGRAQVLLQRAFGPGNLGLQVLEASCPSAPHALPRRAGQRRAQACGRPQPGARLPGSSAAPSLGSLLLILLPPRPSLLPGFSFWASHSGKVAVLLPSSV